MERPPPSDSTVKCVGIPQWIHAFQTKRIKTTDEEVMTTTTDSQNQAQVCCMDLRGVKLLMVRGGVWGRGEDNTNQNQGGETETYHKQKE